MTEYLVCYDYGTGGVWLYLEADSKSAITEKYPALTVFDVPPAWWDAEMETGARKCKENDPFWRKWLEDLSANS